MDICFNFQCVQFCEDYCVDGCFCFLGMVLDDIMYFGCLFFGQCFCIYGGCIYSLGIFFNIICSFCICFGGLWQCQDLLCFGICFVQGGVYIFIYDEKFYDLYGDCSYVLFKKCVDSSFIVLVELWKCGLMDNENCLKVVMFSLDGGDMVIWV